MICKQCGTNCEQSRSFCPVCRAPLPFEETEQLAHQEFSQQGAEPPTQASWGFVSPPQWPKPTFDLNTVDELQIQQAQLNQQQQPAEDIRLQTAPLSPASGQNSMPYQEALYNRGAQYQTIQGTNAPRGNTPYGNTPYRNTQYGNTPYGETQQGNSQAEDVQPPYSVKPIASVGSYDTASGGYKSTGSFGRVPQRTEFDMQEQSEYPAAGQRFNKTNSTPFNRRAAVRRPKANASYRSGSRNNLIFFSAAGVLVVLLIVFTVILLNKNYGSVGGFFQNVFGGSPILKPVEVAEGISPNGEEVWEITVHAREGNTITMRIGDEEISDVINSKNKKIIQIPKNKLMPDKPVEGATAQVAPEVFLTTKEGEIIPVDIPLITVQVPVLALNVTSPPGSSVAVSRSKMAFAGTVDDGTVAVTVQDQPLTVGQDGSFSGEYELKEPGSYTLTLEARKNGYQIARSVFQVEYSQSNASGINIEVDKSSLRAAGESDTVTVKCKLNEGETMAVASSNSKVTLGTPALNSATGYTTFTVKMAEIGYYPIEVTITKDGRTNTGTIIVERAPEYADYTSKVYRMDYARMLKEPQHTARYKCVGTVVEIIESEPYVIAKLSTSTGDILFEYHNVAATVAANDGKTYNIFGDFIGIDASTNLPLVYAWFITK